MTRHWAVSLLLLGPWAAHAADFAEVKTRGQLRAIAAADEAAETFSFTPGPSPGFDRELLEGFVRLHGLQLEGVKAKTYGDRIPALTRGEGDVIVAIFDTEDRRKVVDFTVEVLPTHNVAVTLGSRAPVKSVAELSTLRVGAVRGAKPAEEALAAGVPASALKVFETQGDMTQALRKGTVDAIVLPISEFASASRQTQGLTAGVTVGPRGKIAWAVRKSDVALRQALDQYLTNVRRGPSWSRLVVKYFGDQALKVLGRGVDADEAGAPRP
jgi:polar amino acid transport system substrate-binding protein